MPHQNNNDCPPNIYILLNAILQYKKNTGRTETTDPLLRIINFLQEEIECLMAASGGTAGTNGSSGTSGTNGSSGSSGSTGSSGTSGSTGSSGSSGSTGSSGSSGSSGTSGSTGTSGSSGTNGTSGSSGSRGSSGSSGTSGSSGSSGTSGSSGISPKYALTFNKCIDLSTLVVGEETYLYLAGLSYTKGEVVLVSYDLDNYFIATVISYNTQTNLLILRVDKVKITVDPGTSGTSGTTGTSGDAVFCRWTINLGGGIGGGTTLITGSTYPITSSWALNALYAVTSSLVSSSRFIFPSDLVVSLANSKSFGRYLSGSTIPSTGKTAAEVIQLAIVDSIPPTVTLTSPTTIPFNKIAITNRITSSYIIRSLGATVSTSKLQFRRNNSGSWNQLSSLTTNPLKYTHTLTDSNFNTSSFNYRYLIKDTLDGATTASIDITPTAYVSASATLNVIGTSISLPETNRKRERGNVSTTLSGLISKNSSFVSMSRYSVQFRVNEGNWFDVPGLSDVAMSGNTVTIPSTVHVPTGSANITDIDYQIEVVDTYATSSLSYKSINFFYLFFYGPTPVKPVTSSLVRALPNRLFMDYTGSFNLNAGGAYSIFTVAMPSTFNLSEVLDLDAGYLNLTTNYSQSNFNVMDSGSNATPYHVYTLSNSIAYTDYNHRHRISTTGLLWYTPTITTLDYT